MPRIPYLADEDGPPELIAAIKLRRGGELLTLDRILIHSPVFAGAWGGFLGIVRGGLGLPAALRELAISAVSVVNGCEVEVNAHTAIFVQSGGSQAQVDALKREGVEAWKSPLFNKAEQAVLRFAIEMTRDVKVSDAAFAGVKEVFPDGCSIVELVGAIGAYNMVTRFLVALDIVP